MHKELRPEQIDTLIGTPAVNDEFSRKIRELDRRLQVNGMQYRDWDTLNDRQHEVFTDNLFLDGECASSPEHYVKGAVASCGCPDTEEDLHHHSPVLMREIEKQQDMLPDMTVKIGEGLHHLDNMIDEILEEQFGPHPPGFGGVASHEADFSEDWQIANSRLHRLGDPKTPEDLWHTISQIALTELGEEYGDDWLENEGEWKQGAGMTKYTTKKQVGSPTKQWTLTNGGGRGRRNRILSKIREDLEPVSIFSKITVIKDDPLTKDTGEIYRLQLEFEFPAPDGKLVKVPWNLELEAGMGAGGTVEDAAITGLSAELERVIKENNGQPVTLVFYEGPEGTAESVMSSIKIIEGRAQKGTPGHTGRSGDPKTDIVLLDENKKTVYTISHKQAGGPNKFNQWGGVSDFINEKLGKDIEAFATAAATFLKEDRAASKKDGDPYRHMTWRMDGDQMKLQMEDPGTWPMGFALAGLAGDPLLQLNAIFGLDAYKRDGKQIVRNTTRGIDNVEAVVSGPMRLKKIRDGVYQVLAPEGKIFGPGQLTPADITKEDGIKKFIDEKIGSEYAPIFILRRAGKRKVPGYISTEKIPGEPKTIRRGRFGLFPAGNRGITHWADRAEAADKSVTYTIRSVLKDGNAYIKAGECEGWLCRGKAIADLGGAQTETKVVKVGKKQQKNITGFDLPQKTKQAKNKKGETITILQNEANPENPVPVNIQHLAGKGGPWGKTFSDNYKTTVDAVLKSMAKKK